MARPGSCNNGFRSAPSAGAEIRSNGFEVSSVNSMKPQLNKPRTPRTRAAKDSGKSLL